MAVLNFLDVAKRLDPQGKVHALAELLSQTNPILDDMPFVEGNHPTGHRVGIRTGLTTVYWRLVNQGVQPSKSTSAQIDEQTGMLEAWSEVDKDLAELNGNTAEFRLSEAKAFLEAMNQEAAQTIFYGNSGTSPEEFNGLAIRFSSTAAANGQNIILAGGAGSDNASIYLVGWSPEKVFGIYPKGSKAGLMHEDLGLVTVETTAGVGGSRMRAYQDHFQWKMGLCVKDWRYVVRGANIDISNLVANSGSQADLINLMIKMCHRLPNGGQGCKPVFYMNRSVFQMLDIQRRDDVVAGGINYETVDGKIVPHFRGFPIKVTDALLDSESAIA